MKTTPPVSAVIQPEDIRRKAENLYAQFLQAWLDGVQDFFPYTIRGRRTPGSEELAAAIQAMRRLRDGSKQSRGFGYSIEWQRINSRKFGRNEFPASIFFETQEDYLRFLGRQQEFAAFADVVTQLREAFPCLDNWIRSNSRTLIGVASDMTGLLDVLRYFRDHLRPNLFARELPLALDTKFIERHKPLLRAWFDIALPSYSIRADEDHFERRYGLRYAEPHLYVRLLDSQLAEQWRFPCLELSIPLHTLGSLPLTPDIVFIVENKVNLLTLPPVKRAIGLGGLGHAVTSLRYLPWLQNLPMVYWGDLDVEGLEILSSLRSCFPQARSLLMDISTLNRWESLAIHHAGGRSSVPPHLAEEEQAAYVCCRDNNFRLEQERIPQDEMLRAFDAFLTAQD